MTRRFWLGMTVFCLLIAVASGGFVYLRIQEKAMTRVPLRPVSEPEPLPAPSQETDTPESATSVVASSAAAAVAVSSAPKANVKQPPVAPDEEKNVLFTFFSSSANEVHIVGDFNEWRREPLEKNGKRWTIDVPLAPGRYEYLFIVDGRRVPNPYSKNRTPDGKSVIEVKAPSSASSR